jgi:hypothetical protein
MDRGSRVMKGEYAVTGPEYGHVVGRTVAWDLTRVTAPCTVPPSVPALPAEREPPEDAEP